jgi:hypothetical protein
MYRLDAVEHEVVPINDPDLPSEFILQNVSTINPTRNRKEKRSDTKQERKEVIPHETGKKRGQLTRNRKRGPKASQLMILNRLDAAEHQVVPVNDPDLPTEFLRRSLKLSPG